MLTLDYAVFGAGIAGSSVAYRLLSGPGTPPTLALVEREAQPGMHSTGRSAAMFMESYGPPMVRALTRASRHFYEHPPQGFTDVPLLHPRGALYLAVHGQEDLLARTRNELSATGTALQALDAPEICTRVPCLRRDLVAGGLLEVDAQDIEVHALHQGFLRGLRAQGGQVHTGLELREARHDGQAWTLHFHNGQRWRARTVVNAAGAWADVFAAQFGATRIGLQPRRRSAFTFPAPAGVDVSNWPSVIGVDESYYFKPDAGQLLGSPANADPVPPHDVVPEEIDIATGIHHIEQVTTLTIRRPTSTWAGLRSFVADGEIVIGWDARCPGFFWLAGQGGYGIQSAAGASALAAALLRDEPLPAELRDQGVEPALVAPARVQQATSP